MKKLTKMENRLKKLLNQIYLIRKEIDIINRNYSGIFLEKNQKM